MNVLDSTYKFQFLFNCNTWRLCKPENALGAIAEILFPDKSSVSNNDNGSKAFSPTWVISFVATFSKMREDRWRNVSFVMPCSLLYDKSKVRTEDNPIQSQVSRSMAIMNVRRRRNSTNDNNPLKILFFSAVSGFCSDKSSILSRGRFKNISVSNARLFSEDSPSHAFFSIERMLFPDSWRSVSDSKPKNALPAMTSSSSPVMVSVSSEFKWLNELAFRTFNPK